METYDFDDISNQWSSLSSILTPPESEGQYDRQVDFLDQLLDEIGDDEEHPLASLADTIGALIENYDEKHHSFSQGSPIDALKYLMKEHKLTQKEMPEIGSQGVVSEILSGKRILNSRQIKALSQRFNVSPATFI